MRGWLVSALLLCPAIAGAGAGYDTNHPDVRWRTLHTEHFALHWPESRRKPDDPHWFTTRFTTERLARIAEEAYPAICGQLDYFPKERVHVVIYDQDVGWEGNGFAVAELDWTGFAADWGPLFRQRGRAEFLQDVFVHEFAHIVSLKAYLPWSERTTWLTLGGLAEDEEWLRRWGVTRGKHSTNIDVGVDLTLTVHTPFWWAEGGAEYWSHQAGTNFWGTSRDAYLRTTVLEDRLLGPDEWTTRIDKEGFDGERGYNQGYAFGLYLLQRFEGDAMSEMAKVAAKRWHWSWDKVVEEVTGVDADTLYADWKADLEQRYAAQAEAVRAIGVVEGRELALTEPPWEASGEAAEDFAKLSKKRRDEAMDGDGAWQELPRYSPDGRYLAYFDNGLNVVGLRPEEWGAIGGTWVDDDDGKRVREIGRRWYADDWIRQLAVGWSPDSTQLVAVASEDWAGQLAMDLGLQFNADGYGWNQLVIGTIRDGKRLHVDWKPVPNTLRATEAAFTPDGQSLVFARYGDGTQELWRIGVDGSDPRQLTHFADGTQVQGLSFAADGRLILALYRNYQQDIWRISLDTGELERLTDTAADELDPVVGPDGRVWFASDRTGIYDVYALDLDSGEVRRQTSVLGSAYAPDPTVGGHLLYTDFTGHGYRVRAVAKGALRDEVVAYDGVCLVEGGCAERAESDPVAAPDAVDVAARSRRYSPFEASMPMSIWPVARYTDLNVEVGGALSLGDMAEKHAFEAMTTFGKDHYLSLTYWNQMFWPTLGLGYSRYTYKGTYGYGTDLDGLPETDDLSVVDVKFEQVSDDLWVSASYVPSYALWIGLSADWTRYAFRETGDGNRWQPFLINAGIGAYLEWTPRGGYYSGDDWINPRGGRRLYLDYAYRWSRVVDPETGGAVYDDGELLDRYHYHRLSASWTEFVPVPFTEHHTLQIDLEAGYIDRNVMGWDEFIAGGRHPYDWGNGTIGNNVQFSGFEGYSLYGETLLIGNLSYRFPLFRDLNAKLGPVYADALYLQVFGSAGNLWSYRVEGPSHLEGYSVVPSEGGRVRREAPFADYSAKNSPKGMEHRVLVDVGAELRARAFIWNDWDWDGFVRVAYGFQEIAGYGDVNADRIQSSVARDAATELSAETEPANVRLYIGLGTGW